MPEVKIGTITDSKLAVILNALLSNNGLDGTLNYKPVREGGKIVAMDVYTDQDDGIAQLLEAVTS